MGIDLTLLPLHARPPHRDGSDFASDVLSLNRCSDLFTTIRSLPSELAPVFDSHYGRACEHCEERSYGETRKDAYGDPLRMVQAHQLAALAGHHGVADFGNGAAWAYLQAAKPDTWIVLYWN